MEKKMKHGLTLMLAALVFGMIETFYFGSNLLPESIEELICDFIAIVVMSVGATLFLQGVASEIRKLKR